MTSSTAQQEFERLSDEIYRLQSDLMRTTAALDKVLGFYQRTVLPARQSVSRNLSDCSKLMYEHYKHPTILSEKEIEDLKLLIAHLINRVLAENPDEELIEIIEELKMEKEPAEPKEVAKRENSTAAHREIPRQESGFYEELKKTKRKEELDPRQKKELVSLYRQLVKVLHPDLEQDLGKKLEKEELMKFLINAYENNDLHTLLELEKEWIGGPKKEEEIEQLDIYNSVLREQVEKLQKSVDFAYLNPKYGPLHAYETNDYETLMAVMQEALRMAQTDADNCQSIAKSLRTEQAEEILRNIIAKAMGR